MSKEQYQELLKKHDWFYYMSDDMKAFDAGKNSEANLLKLAKENPEFHDLYNKEYQKYAF